MLCLFGIREDAFRVDGGTRRIPRHFGFFSFLLFYFAHIVHSARSRSILHPNLNYNMRKRQHNGFLLLTLLTLSSLASALCYYPDGRSQTSDEYKKCSYRNGTVSMCCATNREIPSEGNYTKGYTADGCLSNGLCQNKAEITNDDGSTFMATTYWREMCSMPVYGSSGCLDVCTSDSVY